MGIVVVTGVDFLGRVWDVHALIAASLTTIVGTQVIQIGMFGRAYAAYYLDEHDPLFDRMRDRLRLEHGLIAGGLVLLAGLVMCVVIAVAWLDRGFGELSEQKLAVIGMTLVVVGIQIVFASFFLSVLGLSRRPRAERRAHSVPLGAAAPRPSRFCVLRRPDTRVVRMEDPPRSGQRKGVGMNDRSWLGALTGLGFLVLAIAASRDSGAVSPRTPPTTRFEEIIEFYGDNDAAIWIGALLQTLGAALIVFFGGYLRKVLHAAEGPGHMLSNVVLAGATILATGLALDATINIALVETVEDIEPGGVQALERPVVERLPRLRPRRLRVHPGGRDLDHPPRRPAQVARLGGDRARRSRA